MLYSMALWGSLRAKFGVDMATCEDVIDSARWLTRLACADCGGQAILRVTLLARVVPAMTRAGPVTMSRRGSMIGSLDAKNVFGVISVPVE